MEGVGKQEELEKGTLCLMGAMESFSGFLSIGIELSKATVQKNKKLQRDIDIDLTFGEDTADT